MLNNCAITVRISPITMIRPDFLNTLFLLASGNPPIAISINATTSLKISMYTPDMLIISCRDNSIMPAQTSVIFFLFILKSSFLKYGIIVT